MNNLNKLAQKWRAGGGHFEQAADELERAISQAPQGVPETAAEVLAEMFKHAESGASVTPLDVARWADRLERALSAQGEAVAWRVEEKAPWMANAGWAYTSNPGDVTPAHQPLYTHPAPARVPDQAPQGGSPCVDCGGREYGVYNAATATLFCRDCGQINQLPDAPARVTEETMRVLAKLSGAAGLMLSEIDTCGHEVDPAYRATLHEAWEESRAALTAALEDGRHG